MSSKLQSAAEGDLEELELDMSPMIDMVFLLLIFFMVNSTLIVNRLDPEVKIPDGDGAKSPKVASGRIVINIYADGTFGNDEGNKLQEVEITELIDRHRILNKQDGKKSRVLIRADKEAKTEAVKRAVKAAGDAGVEDVIFSAYSVSPKS